MRLLLGLIGSLAVLALLMVLMFLLMPAERLAQIAIDRVAQDTGREITIEAAARPTLWPDLTFSVEGLRVANPDWAGSRPLLQADAAVLRVGWQAIFGGRGTVEHLDLTGADLTLVRGEDHRLSWRDGDRALLPLVLQQVDLRGGRVRYLDRAAGTALDIRQVSASLDLNEGASGSAAFVTSGVAQGTRMELSGTITQAARFFEGTAQPIRLDLLWSDGNLRFNGRSGLGSGANGRLDLRATDLAPLVRLAGREMPDVLEQLTGDEIAVQGTVSLAEGGSLHLREGVIALGETRLNTALDLVPGEERPLVRGTINGGQIGTADLFDVNALAPDGTWSRETIDVSGLFSIDADLTVRAETLTIGSMPLTGMDLRVALTRGRLVFDIARIGMAEGQLAGEFVINGRGGLSVGGDLLLANAQARTFTEALQGRGSASLEFLGVGNDLHTILAGLEAEGDLFLGRGVLLGVDIPGLARNDDELADSTEFDRLVAEFRIRNGAVISEDLLLDGPWGGFVGDGRLDLLERDMQYRLTPENWTGAEDVVPVLVDGPWTDPEIRPDEEAVRAAAEAAAEERARAAELGRFLGGSTEGSGSEDEETGE